MATSRFQSGGAFLPSDPINLTGDASNFVNAPTIGGTALVPGTSVMVGSSDTQTLTNKTLTSPVLGGSVTGTYTLAGTGTQTAPTINTATLNGPIYSEYKVLAAPAAYSATVTPALITGFAWTVVPGSYIFEMNLPITVTTVGGLTISFVLTTATLTSIQYQSYASTATDNGTAVSTTGTTATSATKVYDSKTAAYTYVKIWGSMVVATGGTFQWDGCQNTSAGAGDASTILTGAYAKLMRVS